MTRTAAREIALRISFGIGSDGFSAADAVEDMLEREHYDTFAGEDEVFSEKPDKKQAEYIMNTVCGIEAHFDELNGYIERYSSGWKVLRISRTAAAVMRLAVYEVLYAEDVPERAAINEAVELAKKYDEPQTVSFINGILGSFARGRAE